MQGHRLTDGFHYRDSRPGDYWKQLLGTRDVPGDKFLWTVKDPCGTLGTISRHTIVEHEDGTITVTPSILHTSGTGMNYHGFLEHGVWRNA